MLNVHFELMTRKDSEGRLNRCGWSGEHVSHSFRILLTLSTKRSIDGGLPGSSLPLPSPLLLLHRQSWRLYSSCWISRLSQNQYRWYAERDRVTVRRTTTTSWKSMKSWSLRYCCSRRCSSCWARKRLEKPRKNSIQDNHSSYRLRLTTTQFENPPAVMKAYGKKQSARNSRLGKFRY